MTGLEAFRSECTAHHLSRRRRCSDFRRSHRSLQRSTATAEQHGSGSAATRSEASPHDRPGRNGSVVWISRHVVPQPAATTATTSSKNRGGSWTPLRSSLKRVGSSEANPRSAAMAAAAGGGRPAKRKNGIVVWAGGGGGGGLLLLGGGLLAATAALGVAFFVRAATKRKAPTKGSPQGAGQEQKRSSAACGGEGVAEQGEEREKIPSVLLPPPPQAALPPPPRQVEENSGSTATSGESAATAGEFDFGRVEEKVIEESSLVGGRRGGGGGEEGPLPAVVNKAMVVNEPKIIQVVGEAPPSSPAGGEEDEGSPVADGAEESSGKPGGSSPTAGADNLESHEEVTRPAKATKPTSLPSLEVMIRSGAKRVAMAMIKGKVFVRGAGEKLIRAEEEKMVPWKESRMQAREMREKGVMDKMGAVEILIRERGFFSRNAQMVILVSTVLFTALMAILLRHYSRLPESTQHV